MRLPSSGLSLRCADTAQLIDKLHTPAAVAREPSFRWGFKSAGLARGRGPTSPEAAVFSTKGDPVFLGLVTVGVSPMWRAGMAAREASAMEEEGGKPGLGSGDRWEMSS